MLDYNNCQTLNTLLNSYQSGNLDLFELLDESLKFFDSIRGVAGWLTSQGQKPFDGYCFDDLVDYYRQSL